MKYAILIGLTFLAAAEPAPRKLTGSAIRTDVTFRDIAGVYELKGGKLLVSDPETPAVYMLDAATGKTHKLGSVGAGPGRYARPGGFYRGSADTVLLVDRGQTRAIVFTQQGEIVDSRSIAKQGTMSSSPGADLQRLDGAGLVYTLERTPGDAPSDSNFVMRLNAVTQKQDRVAGLMKAAQKTVRLDAHRTTSRPVVGSPADGWGVASDGRIAIVRAAPYRVEWHSPSGRVTKGPVIQYDVIKMTDDEKKAWAARAVESVSVGQVGEKNSANEKRDVFAATKAPFEAFSVRVAPDGRVWVKRSTPTRATTSVYDIFDADGKRADRVALPLDATIVGFGAGSVYVAKGEKDRVLMRYTL